MIIGHQTRWFTSRKEITMKTRQSIVRFPSRLKDLRKCMEWGVLFPAVYMLSLGGPAIAQQHTITTIDAPGAFNSSGHGTEGIAITPWGAIAGFYADQKNAMHAYVRATDGRIITFDAPGAASSGEEIPFPTVGASPGTYAVGIDVWGAVTGYSIDAFNVSHGYLRYPDGTFTAIDVLEAGKGDGQGTSPGSMNWAGVITGNYVDASGAWHGFVRARDGAITKFDAPGAGTEAGQGTMGGWAQCINPVGTIVGYFIDANNVIHGFVRDHGGVITTLEAPGAGTEAGQGTFTWAINPSGAVAGTFLDSHNVYHGLVRTADGSMEVFDAPGAGTGADQGTQGMGIDPAGEVTGYYTDATGVSHGFLRSAHGEFTYLDVQDAGRGSGQGTFPMTNTQAETTGFYVDSNNVWHGFVRK